MLSNIGLRLHTGAHTCYYICTRGKFHTLLLYVATRSYVLLPQPIVILVVSISDSCILGFWCLECSNDAQRM